MCRTPFLCFFRSPRPPSAPRFCPGKPTCVDYNSGLLALWHPVRCCQWGSLQSRKEERTVKQGVCSPDFSQSSHFGLAVSLPKSYGFSWPSPFQTCSFLHPLGLGWYSYRVTVSVPGFTYNLFISLYVIL